MAPSVPPITVRLFRTVHVSGCPIEGEVELNFRGIHEEDIQEVHVKLRGVARTYVMHCLQTPKPTHAADPRCITHDKEDHYQHIPLFQGDAILWRRGDAYPPPGSDTLRFPFRFQLKPDLPPSFKFASLSRKASVLYAISAVGVRPGTFNSNHRVRVPLAIVPADPAGVLIREKLNTIRSVESEVGWRTEWNEAKIRRGLWGEYSTVQVLLSIPNLPAYPLHVSIPFIIKIKSISATLARAKADALPADKPAFPAVPVTYEQLTFKLKSKMRIQARAHKDTPTSDVMVFARGATSEAFTADVPPREWVPLESDGGDEKKRGEVGPETKGTWIQRATFQSSFRLDCPPTFSTETIQCDYALAVRVPFPGMGNDFHLDMPIVITSGITAPVLREWSDGSSITCPPLRLPPEYWDGSSLEWMVMKD
ncbi:hypothetical protein TRAPUB_13175 [Trametes pubescens]|uniref:Arrestin-like N-terminal domain-containing protein n=1 Tax=Trametes pubescens TaxID=154538 RepID=A0A1M2VRT5_TRAPU|nr:hypothetical protein TRAPUB_13175 [Trametes pubescens]